MTPGDAGIRVVVRAAEVPGARTMITLYEHGNLVTPWLVRHAIEHAIAGGWDPRGRGAAITFRIPGVLADRAVTNVLQAGLAVAEEQLIDAIADEVDGARLVYADWLLERGDPRGEYLALADAAERGVALDGNDRARLDELAAQRNAWLGPIVEVTSGRWWRRGLFDSCRLGKRVPGAIDRALGHAGWATVRSIDAHGEFMTAEAIARVVTQPQLRSLASLAMDYRTAKEVVAIGAPLPRVRELAIAHGGAQLDVLDGLARLMSAGGRIAAHVHDPATLAALLGAVALAEVVVIDPSFEKFATWLPAIAEAPSARVRVVKFAQLVSGQAAHGGWFEVSRGADGRWSALRIGWSAADWQYARDTLLGALARVDGAAFSAVTIDAGPAPLDDARFRRAVIDRLRRQRAFQDFGAK